MEADGDLLHGLDPHQRQAVTIDQHPLAIIAAAGSGKTTVLTRRIAERVRTGSADADHVVALTFTRQAATELRSRLGKLGVRGTGLRVGTFHAVAHSVLRQRWADLSRRPPTLVVNKQRLLSDVLGSADAGEAHAVAAEIDWARATLTEPERYGPAARAHGRSSHVSADRVATAMADYAVLKKRRGVIDFDDLLADCAAELRRDRQYAAGVRWRFRHFFVDEFQDLNPLQAGLLDAWRNGRPDICVVGDPRQAIYGWNGSDPTLLEHVERTLPGVTIVRLRTNYRSTPQVVAAAAHVLGSSHGDDTVSARPDGPAVRWLAAGDERDEAAQIATIARDHRAPGTRWASIGVLTRTNAQLSVIADGLARLHIPVALPAAGLRPALDADAASLINDARRLRNPTELTAWGVDLAEGIEGRPATAAATEVAQAVRRFVGEMPGGDGSAFADWFMVGAAQPAADAVELLTFHAAKGREWRTVIVAGFETDLVPHYSARGRDARTEEHRLAHVALSRATEHLVVTWATERNGRPTGPSELTPAPTPDDGLIVRAVATPVVSGAAIDASAVAALASLHAWRDRAARAAQLPAHSICSDAVLRKLAQTLPAALDDTIRLAGLGPSSAGRLGPRLHAAVEAARATTGAASAPAAQAPPGPANLDESSQSMSTITGA